MRSQASKSLPKKGTLSKTSFKPASTTKQVAKKAISPRKAKKLVNKSLVKNSKKNVSKDNTKGSRNDGEAAACDKTEPPPQPAKAGPSKTTSPRSDSPTKKSKKEPKENKDTSKTSSESHVKKVVPQKIIKSAKKPKNNKSNAKKKGNNKANLDEAKKSASKFSKAKTVIKKSTAGNQKKKKSIQSKQEILEKDKREKIKDNRDDLVKNEENNKSTEIESKSVENENVKKEKDEIKLEEKVEMKSCTDIPMTCNTPSKVSVASQPETPKAETERPPKFFTSSRSPRMVDIDVKCCKTSKGNLSVSERFISMKFETKTEDKKDNFFSNTLVSQGPDIDVYTFTEKVDSPKSVLSDFCSPINKNIGRVRPIARVKGTVIDKKTDLEKKKFSPHRPIEEVVKLLKASKRSEELNASQNQSNASVISSEATAVISGDKEEDDKPKPIVSKSYKMVARKSSITGQPFSPIKFLDQESSPSKNDKPAKTSPVAIKPPAKAKKQNKKSGLSDEDLDKSKFALNEKPLQYTSSEESVNESNDDNDTKETSESDTPKSKKTKNKKYKRITDSAKKSKESKELKELSKDSLTDLKGECALLIGEKPSKRRLKLLSMWSGPKKHRMASLNALAKVHCLYENESRTHMELGLMRTVDRQVASTSKAIVSKKKDNKPKDTEKQVSTSESEYEQKTNKKEDSSESSDDNPPQRTLRGVPGIRSAGKYWDPKSSTSSSEDSELETKKKSSNADKKKTSHKLPSGKSDSDKPPTKMKKTAGVPVKKKRNRNEVVMDLKDMVVQKRMASLNATAILAASYEKRSPKSSKDETTSDSCSDESFSQKPKNGVSSGVKSETKNGDAKNEFSEATIADKKQKVEVIVNQDTDVTITGVYSTHHHEGFCTVSGMQYRISSTSHTQTTATANCEKESCTREDGSRYTPLSALSSMQPPAEQGDPSPSPVNDLGGLARRPGCASAFSAPTTAAHHDQGYYQPAGPLIKETNAEAERALARYHASHHPPYHPPHPPPVLPQYGPYYSELCYGRYYRPSAQYHMPPPQPDAPIVGVSNEPPYPPQYYAASPCYQHPPQRIPTYVDYHGCSCPLNSCPKNVHIGPATGKAPAGGGPAEVHSALAPPGGAFRSKVRACALDAAADIHGSHGSGKDPPKRLEPPVATNAPYPCPLPAMGGVSPKREIYDTRDNLRRPGELPLPNVLGPLSPARGSAGACTAQPPPSKGHRRARLGKAMARRSLVGDDTGILLSAPQPPLVHHSDVDDDVLAISPPISAPIDLSSSDERSTPLVDVKKENEGPTYASTRKPDAQALREHNSTTVADTPIVTDTSKAVKRRYSRPKLEIDMKDTQLEDGCRTNGIGEHVKLQKRRKVSGDTDISRTETITKEPKKKASQTKRTPKIPSTEKKTTTKRKNESIAGPRAKKMLLDAPNDDDLRLKNVATLTEESPISKPKTKSALLLDNLIRKNSIERSDSKGYTSETELNPAELFLPLNENMNQNGVKKLNINNNIVENSTSISSVRPNTIVAVSQFIGKKLACKNACKMDKVDSKVTHSLKSVLKTPTAKPCLKEDQNVMNKLDSIENKDTKYVSNDNEGGMRQIEIKDKSAEECEFIKDTANDCSIIENGTDIPEITSKSPKATKQQKDQVNDNHQSNGDCDESQTNKPDAEKGDRLKDKGKCLEAPQPERIAGKRCKVNGELKGKSVEKVVKLLVSKRPAIKTDDATLVVEEACASPAPGQGTSSRRARRRAGATPRRARRQLVPAAPIDLQPRAPPRWSNGWNWDGEHYLSKVYLNNDSRLDRTARCWSRMTHASGDRVARGDCVLLRASVARAQPFVARVASLWENPEDGEMMVSLVWYYRPEHTERGRQPDDAPDEVFASRHRDANSVACIEDKCYVLTYNEYCRYRKRLKAAEEGISVRPSIVPPMPACEVSPAVAPNDSKLPPTVSPELVLFCRKIYDFRSKKIHMPNK